MTPEYAAGFFDGEGCISVKRVTRPGQRLGYLLRAQINHTHFPTLQQLKTQWGGYIGSVKQMESRYKTRWQWALDGDSLVKFLQDIRPFLIEKTPQVEMALQFVAEKTADRRALTPEQLAVREGYYLALRQAKTKQEGA